MLQALLGFDSEILAKTSLKEQAGYRLAGWLFALVSLSMVHGLVIFFMPAGQELFFRVFFSATSILLFTAWP